MHIQRLPHSGRHSARIWLPQVAPRVDAGGAHRWITFGMPGHTTDIDGVTISNNTKYHVELFARSFPPGLQVQVSVGTSKRLFLERAHLFTKQKRCTELSY